MIQRVLPAVVAGLAAWLAYVLIGNTPLIRASGLALVVVAVAAMLTRWGRAVAVAGGLAFAFSPAFWSQTGGGETVSAAAVAVALALAVAATLGIAAALKQPWVGLALGFVLFAGLFIGVFGTPRSLRLTTLLAAWTLLLLVDSLMRTNPRPDEAPATPLPASHRYGLLLLIIAGVLNDPLFALVIPAVGLGLWLSRAILPRWYWPVLLGVLLYGAFGVAQIYIDPDWTRFPAAQAEVVGIRVPFLMADGWWVGSRWIYLLGLVVEQFTPFGLALGVVGLARMARWYPPLGVVLMIGYATYFVFGLVYFGKDSAVLLLPLFMIQAVWITYAVYSLGQWMQRSPMLARPVVRWLAPVAFTLLPLFLLLRIAGRI